MFIALDHIVYFDHILHAYAIRNHWHAKPLFMDGVSFKLANIQRWPCKLLSVDFPLHKVNLSYVLNMLNFYIFR